MFDFFRQCLDFDGFLVFLRVEVFWIYITFWIFGFFRIFLGISWICVRMVPFYKLELVRYFGILIYFFKKKEFQAFYRIFWDFQEFLGFLGFLGFFRAFHISFIFFSNFRISANVGIFGIFEVFRILGLFYLCDFPECRVFLWHLA